MNDEQANDEEPDAHEDLDAAFLCLVANLAGGGEKEHERERVQAVHEPVLLGLRERENERDGGHPGENSCWRIDDRHGYRGGNPERRTDGLSPDPISLSDQDVERQYENRLRNPVRLGPSQCHTDRRGATKTTPNTIATLAAAGGDRRYPSTTAGAPNRRAMTMP